MSPLFRTRKNVIVSSRLFLVFVIVIAAFLAAFLGQLAINDMSRLPSLVNNPIIRTSPDELSKLTRAASRILANERTASVETWLQIEPLAEASVDGLVLTNDGWVVTLSNRTLPAFVRLQSGELLEVEKSVVDTYAPLAFLKIDANNLHPANLSGRRDLPALDPVLLFGANGEMLIGRLSGRLSYPGADYDADSLNRFDRVTYGRPGQAVYDAGGEVLGLVIDGSSDQSSASFVSGSYIRTAFNEVLKNQRVARAAIGARYIDLASQPVPETLSYGQNSGALLTVVAPTGAAAKAGLRVNDIVVAVEGTPLSNRASLSDIVHELGVGTTVSLSILRRGAPLTLELTTGE
ncbi:MAG: serine protease [Parcubacteria group bacterium]|nr:serine protease [Parcubacteria group bacterium]